MSSAEQITELLSHLRRGDPEAVNQLTPLLYRELRSIADRTLRGQRPDHTLQATALVNEAYVRMLGSTQLSLQNRAHFLAVAAQAMRQILVDHARGRSRKKRRGDRDQVPLDGLLLSDGTDPVDLLALDEALGALARHDARKSRVVELCFFGGLTHEETAAVLDVATRTVERDWRYSQAWLRRQLDPGN